MKRFPQRKESRILFTPDGYRKILDEKAKLAAERPDAVEHLRKAREMGDLSENGYYKAARARLSFIDARLRRAERLLKLAKIVESAHSGMAEIGSHVFLNNGTRDVDYTIVGSFESDPAQKTISHVSPLGKALMGKKAGDRAVVQLPNGSVTYSILNIE